MYWANIGDWAHFCLFELNHTQKGEFLFIPSTDQSSPTRYPLFYVYICRGDPCQFVFLSCGLVISISTWWVKKLEFADYSLNSDCIRASLGCKWDGFTRGTTSRSLFVNFLSRSGVRRWVLSLYPPKMRSWYLPFLPFTYGLLHILTTFNRYH